LVAAALALAGCGSDSLTDPSYFRAEDIVVGEGNPAVAGDNLTVHYIGSLENGQVFESSYDRGQPYSFRLGARTVIQGWDQGLVGMRVGGKRRLTIPPALAYGEQGQPPFIPGNETLTFEIELVANAGP
jgi:FKBP-type peptidyl-prolyl cis-trans isomerase